MFNFTFRMLKIILAYIVLALATNVKSALVINLTDAEVELPTDIIIPHDELTFCVRLRFGENIAAVKLFGEFGDNLCLWIRYDGGYGLSASKMYISFLFYQKNLGFNP